jgi:predicted  nucleic acid-binding Zn-ribbon protein
MEFNMDKNQLIINELLQRLATAQYEAVQLRAELTIANQRNSELEDKLATLMPKDDDLKGGDE